MILLGSSNLPTIPLVQGGVLGLGLDITNASYPRAKGPCSGCMVSARYAGRQVAEDLVPRSLNASMT